MNIEQVQELLNADYGYGNTALMISCSHLKIDLAKRLISAGSNVNQEGERRQTALTETIDAFVSGEKEDEHIKLELVKLLIKNGANVNQKYRLGMTPLLSAMYKCSLALIEELIHHGADVNHFQKNGITPLISAVERGDIDIIKILLYNGAKVNHRTNSGETALIKTIKKIRYGKETLREACAHKLKIMDILFEYNADPDLKDKDGYTSLMIAATKNQREIIQKLLEAGADPKIKNGTNDFYDYLKFKKTRNWVLSYIDNFGSYKTRERNHLQSSYNREYEKLLKNVIWN
ncbi:MAG: ankyrin repeat domain-containing protein [Bacteroidales bacterium]|nr:ankyrin repeat domain-containing protein [Bacteroidales bacterium]